MHELVGDPLLYAVHASCSLLREFERHVHVLHAWQIIARLFYLIHMCAPKAVALGLSCCPTVEAIILGQARMRAQTLVEG